MSNMLPKAGWKYLLLTSTQRFIYDLNTLGRKKEGAEKVIYNILNWRGNLRAWYQFKFKKKVRKVIFPFLPKKYITFYNDSGCWDYNTYAVVFNKWCCYRRKDGSVMRWEKFYSREHVKWGWCHSLEEVIAQMQERQIEWDRVQKQEKLDQLLRGGGIQKEV